MERSETVYIVNLYTFSRSLRLQHFVTKKQIWSIHGVCVSHKLLTDNHNKRDIRIIKFRGSVTKYNVCAIHGVNCDKNHTYQLYFSSYNTSNNVINP